MPSMNFGFPKAVNLNVCIVPVLFTLAACVSSGPTPDQMSRTAVETAPADLQLVCATEASKMLSTDANKTLPVSSRRIDASTYEVRLSTEGKYANCTVAQNGSVLAVKVE